jgi:GT2 family glycosyltransferase
VIAGSLDLSVIVVNWNTRELLRECLAAVVAQTSSSFEVFVVDNGSADGSAEMVRECFPAIKLVAWETNRGFAVASNHAAALAAGRYLLLLNSDTETRPGAFARGVEFLDANPHFAAAGLGLVNADGTVQNSCAAFPTVGKELFFALGLHRVLPKRIGARFRLELDAPTEPRAVDWSTGAALLIRRTAWESVGPLDANLFMYAEDLDWCYRATRAGHAIGYLPGSWVLHHGDASSRRRWGAGVNAVVFHHSRRVLTRHLGPRRATLWAVAVSAGAFPRWVTFDVFSRLAHGRRRARLRRRADEYRHTLLGLWSKRADVQGGSEPGSVSP